MHANDALKQAAATAGVPITHIRPALGKAPNYVNNSSSRGSTPRCDTMAAMLGVCGYAPCAIPRADVLESTIEIREAPQKKTLVRRKGCLDKQEPRGITIFRVSDLPGLSLLIIHSHGREYQDARHGHP